MPAAGNPAPKPRQRRILRSFSSSFSCAAARDGSASASAKRLSCGLCWSTLARMITGLEVPDAGAQITDFLWLSTTI